MEFQKIFQKKIKRKNFIYTIGAGIAGYSLLSSFPFRFFGKKRLKKLSAKEKVKVRINPLAVRRNNIGGNNGRS